MQFNNFGVNVLSLLLFPDVSGLLLTWSSIKHALLYLV